MVCALSDKPEIRSPHKLAKITRSAVMFRFIYLVQVSVLAQPGKQPRTQSICRFEFGFRRSHKKSDPSELNWFVSARCLAAIGSSRNPGDWHL
jgi:hypothetical protein